MILRFCIVLMVGILSLPLAAQTKVLPEVEISSDAVIRALLHKKNLAFPLETAPDSLPPFLPQGFGGMLRQRIPVPRRMATASFDLATQFQTTLQGSLYHKVAMLPQLGFLAAYAAPGNERGYEHLSLNGRIPLPENWVLQPRISYQSIQSKTLASDNLHIGIAGFGDHYQLHNVAFSRMRTLLGLQLGSQDAESQQRSITYLDLFHQHDLAYAGHTWQNTLVCQSGAPGFSVLYDYPEDFLGLPDWKMGLLTDFDHLFPSLEFFQRFILVPNQYLEIANQPYIKGWSRHLILDGQPYAAISSKSRLTSVPLNFSLHYYQMFDQTIIQQAAVSHQISYLVNSPQFSGKNYLATAELVYADLLENQTRLDLKMIYQEVDLNHYLVFNLRHLPDSGWSRQPYSAALRIGSEASYGWNNFKFNASLIQEYFIRDEFNRNLPAVFDLSFKAEYPVNRDLLVSASLNNLFNTPHHVWSNLPSQGRYLAAGIRYVLR